MQAILEEEELKDSVILVYANKQARVIKAGGKTGFVKSCLNDATGTQAWALRCTPTGRAVCLKVL